MFSYREFATFSSISYDWITKAFFSQNQQKIFFVRAYGYFFKIHSFISGKIVGFCWIWLNFEFFLAEISKYLLAACTVFSSWSRIIALFSDECLPWTLRKTKTFFNVQYVVSFLAQSQVYHGILKGTKLEENATNALNVRPVLKTNHPL